MMYSIASHLLESASVLRNTHSLSAQIEEIAVILETSLQNGGCVYWFGNGGSASDAEHLAAELSGRFALDRDPLNSHALTANSSAITAIANDYGYENVFSRQIKAHARKNDTAIGISTSGKSKNVINALQAAYEIGCHTILLTGETAPEYAGVTHTIRIPSSDTAHIQEAHIAVGQAICGKVEDAFFAI